MDTTSFFTETFRWDLSLIAWVAVMAIPLCAKYLITLVPTFKSIQRQNQSVAEKQVTKPRYNAIQKRSKVWGLTATAAIMLLIVPFVITMEPQPWWEILLDVFIILMFYDFWYYLVHRFLFHDGGFGPGPLMWVHAVHHQQKDPCRMDSNFLHPLETAAGLSLYGVSIGVLGWILGDFHLYTIIITWIAFSEINLHNHDRQEADHFPFKYLKYMSDMHHVHHSRFVAGNFATISLFYDWLFGTYDTGEGWGKHLQQQQKLQEQS